MVKILERGCGDKATPCPYTPAPYSACQGTIAEHEYLTITIIVAIVSHTPDLAARRRAIARPIGRDNPSKIRRLCFDVLDTALV